MAGAAAARFAETPASLPEVVGAAPIGEHDRVDALSEVLGAVRLAGAIFFDVHCGAPWGFRVPSTERAGDLLGTREGRLINYHLVTQGQARARVSGGDEVLARAGDVVVFPHGDAHTVCDGDPEAIADSEAPVEEVLSGRPKSVCLGGAGRQTRIICGFFACERHADHLFLSGLPPVFKVGLRGDPTGAWLEQSAQRLVGEAAAERPGAAALLSRMAEVLFVETLRRFMQHLPVEQTGWLAGARDPVVGAALTCLHRDPGRRWTAAALAAEVGASRSVLGARFARFLGEPPLSYLARWRLQLAAQRLERGDETVLAIATGVGYQSESAFNRAFKREFGLPPARYRRVRRDG